MYFTLRAEIHDDALQNGDRTAVQRGGAFCRTGRRAASLDRLRRPRKRESGAIRPLPIGMMAVRRS